MSRQVQFVGGPHDGLTLSSGLGAAFLFTDGKRCFRAPAAGRSLYRVMHARSGPLMYVFVGYEYGLCKCGVFRRRDRGDCEMCGAAEFVG